jgi:hypothetical protein
MYDETTIQPHDDQADRGYEMADVTPEPNRSGKGPLVLLGIGIVALLVLIAGVFLAVHSRNDAVGFTQTATNGTVAPGTSSAVDQAAADAPADATASSVAGNGATGNAPTGAPAGKAPAAPAAPTGPAPTITSFHTPDNIDCHNGNFQTFSASWTTTNATKTTISIDGPGLYKTYGPNADESLPFNCSSAHSFTLTAFGANGKTATKTITLQPRNVQPPQTDDPGDEAPTSTPKAPVSTVPGPVKHI